MSIRDLNGNVMIFPSDGRGHVSGISSNDDLVSFTDRESNTTTFGYGVNADGTQAPPHYLTQIHDPRGPNSTPLSNHYDSNGRLDYTQDALGRKTYFNHDLTGHTETTTDRRGFKTVMSYDSYGNVTSTQRELRDGSGAFLRWIKTESTFDTNGANPDQPTSVTQYLENGRAIVSKMTYDADGNVLSVLDPLGHKTLLRYANSRVLDVQDARAIAGGYYTVQNQYDSKGNLLSSKDALGHTTSFTYFANGLPKTVTDPLGRSTTFALDSVGNISTVTDATGHATTFSYDINGNKTKTTTTRTVGLGTNTSVETLTSQVLYDSDDRPIGAIAPDGVRSAVVYNALGQADHTTRALGTSVERTTSYVYDELGQRVKTVMPDGGFTTTNYDEAGQVSTSFDRIGRGSLSDYDSLGRLVHSYQIKPGAGSIQSRLVLDAQGNPLSGETRYDDLGRVSSTRDARGYVSSMVYDDAGNALQSTDALGRVSKTDYDELNRGYRSVDAKAHVTTTIFDNAGRATRTTFADGTYTETTYDELNRAVATRDQMGKIRRVHYDVLGRMDWVEVPLDQANNKVLRTRFGFNELGQKVWQQDAKGVATDKASGLNVDTDAPVSRVTRFAYDKRGRLVARVLPGSVDGIVNGVPLNEAMEYNELGQLTRKRDFRGYWTSFAYDVRGRMTAKIPSAALNEMPVEYSYPDELTMTSRRGLVTTTQHYDSDRGWLNQVESPNGTLNFSHNVFGQMTGMGVVSGGTTRNTNYGYDELSRLKQITSFNGDVWNYGYDEVGNKASLSRPNGVTTTYGYDTLNRLTDLANAKAGTTLSRFNYHLRADGRRDQLNETIAQPDGTSVTRAIQYSFDDANRLTAESGTDGSGKNYSKTYTLDEAGNRQKLVSTLDASTTTTNYSYNDLDWMTQQSVIAPSSTTTTNYAYDANGSQTGITAQVGAAAPTYTKQVWDFEGHLTARGATDAQGNWGNSRNEYSYDANGLRLSQSTVVQSGVTSAKTSYLWNGDRLLEERDKDNVLLARYEHGQELGPLSMLRPATGSIAAQTRYFIGDGQDSTRQLLDETGVVKDSYFYDSFGVDVNGGQQTSTNSFKYTGQQQDESGLYYLRARYYDTGSGRFLSHDPLLGGSDDPISMHRYLYAGVDPVNASDPSGKETLFGFNVSMSMQTMLANGAVFAATSAWDTALAGGNSWNVAKSAGAGLIIGATVGRLSKVAAFTKILWGLGVIGQGTAIYDAYTRRNLNLLFFRVAALATPVVAKQILNFRATTLEQENLGTGEETGESTSEIEGGAEESTGYNPSISDDGESVRADYPSDSTAEIQYERVEGGIELHSYFSGQGAKGAGSEMLSEVLLSQGDKPGSIRVVAILNKPTIAALESGASASETLLAKSVSRAIDYIGGKCVNWQASKGPDGDWQIKSEVKYGD